jgi:hypothetical protein
VHNTHNAYVIEVSGISAGLIVRPERGRDFRFVATDHRFSVLDGSRFSSPYAAQTSAERHLKALETLKEKDGAGNVVAFSRYVA